MKKPALTWNKQSEEFKFFMLPHDEKDWKKMSDKNKTSYIACFNKQMKDLEMHHE